MQPVPMCWKGWPRRRLPRIRTASPNEQKAPVSEVAHHVFSTPLGSELDELRRESRLAAAARRRQKLSRRTSTVSFSTGQSSKITQRKGRQQKGDRINQQKEVRLLGESPSRGTRAAGTPPWNPRATDTRYSVLHEVDINTPYWGDLPPSRRESKAVRTKFQSLPTLDTGAGGIQSKTQLAHRSRTYDPRLPIRKPTVRKRGSVLKRSPSVHGHMVEASDRAASVKQDILRSPEFREAIRQSIVELRAMSPLSSLNSIISSSDLHSPDEKRALDKFALELQRHLLAQEAIRNASLQSSRRPSITLSPSCSSDYTVIDFSPYANEFKAAGLSVAPAQHRRKPAVPVKAYIEVDGNDLRNASRLPDHHHSESPGSPHVSESTGSVLTFTPYVYTRRPPCIERTETDNWKRTPRKSLPWLRNDHSPGVGPRPSASSHVTTVIDWGPHRTGRPLDTMNAVQIKSRLEPVDMNIGPKKQQSWNTEVMRRSIGDQLPVVPPRPPPKIPAISPVLTPIATGAGISLSESDPILEEAKEILISPYVSPSSSLKQDHVPQADGGRSFAIKKGKTMPICLPKDTHDQQPFDVQLRRSLGFDSALIARQKRWVREDEGLPSKDQMPSPLEPTPSVPTPLKTTSPRLNSVHTKMLPISKDTSGQDQPFEWQQVIDHATKTWRVRKDRFTQTTPCCDLVLDAITQTGPSLTSVSSMATNSNVSKDSDPPLRKVVIAPEHTSLDTDTITSINDTSVSTIPPKQHISTASVLSGLQIALLASQDKKVDRLIEELSGLQVRKYLSDLSAFDGVTLPELSKLARMKKKGLKIMSGVAEEEGMDGVEHDAPVDRAVGKGKGRAYWAADSDV